MMKSVIRLATGIAALALSVGLGHAAERWSVATSSTGSSPYILGSTMAQVVNGAQKKIELSAQTSGGYNENISLVADGNTTLGITFVSDLIDAYAGTGKFTNLPGKERFKNLRLMFPVELSTYHYVTRADSGIKTFAELKGKKFNLNVPATATRQLNETLISALGMKPSDFKVFSISTGKSFDALEDGIVDATGNGLAVPASQILQLAAQVPVHLIPVDKALIDKLNAHYHDTLIARTIPANTYPGQKEATPTFAVSSALFVKKDAPDDLVYAFTKAYYENLKTLQEKYGSFRGLTIKDANIKADIPIHPGALRYLREQHVIQ